MMKLSAISKMLVISIAFSMSLLLIRFFYSKTMDYSFYGWNTFLATIPYASATWLLKLKRLKSSAIFLLATWLVFFPNAPYLITDILHYEERPPVPFWFDILLVISATWNGLILGITSLINVETFLLRYVKPIWVRVLVFFSLLLCSYGIFLGRFLRFNSWNIITDPAYLAYTTAHHVLLPHNYPKLWVFTILFAVLLSIIFFTLKKLPRSDE